jgi:hypothetical protein
MENQAKRLKLQADPLSVLCEDVLYLIFQHFDDRFTTFNIFEVSKSWNLRLSQSAAAMRKIKLVFPNTLGSYPGYAKSVSDFVGTLSKSKRMYRNVEFEITNIAKWKRKMQLLERFSSTIVEMDVNYKVSRTAKHDQSVGFTFPNLTSIEITEQVYSEFIGNLIVASPKLEKVVFCNSITSGRTLGSIEKNTSVKKLTMLNTGLTPNFCPSSLTNFKFSYKPLENYKEELRLEDWLANSFDTLTTLSLYEIQTESVFFILTKLPALKTLEFWRAQGEKEEIADLKNFNITTVKMVRELNPFTQQLLECLKSLLSYSCKENFSTVCFKRSSPTEKTWEKSSTNYDWIDYRILFL